jgi:cation diffusion facilitator family transporter
VHKEIVVSHEIMSEEKRKAAKSSTLVSVVINIVLATAQILIGLTSGSSALVADGIHSISDLFSDFVVLFVNRHSCKEADADHNYGHHRYETAASLFLGLSLLAVGSMMIWNAGYKIIFHPAAAQVQATALWVAIVALVSKEILFRYMLKIAEKVRSSMLVANAWHARSDAASSLLVAIGIAGALMGYPVLDVVGALFVGLVIVKMGFEFSWDALHDLMDRAISEEESVKIRNIIVETSKVRGCHDLRTRKMGDMIFVDVHIEVDGSLSVREGHDIAAKVRENVVSKLPVLDMMIHIDPV